MLLVLFIFFDPLAKKLFRPAKTFFKTSWGTPKRFFSRKKGSETFNYKIDMIMGLVTKVCSWHKNNKVVLYVRLFWEEIKKGD